MWQSERARNGTAVARTSVGEQRLASRLDGDVDHDGAVRCGEAD